jgi:hypothetical protein
MEICIDGNGGDSCPDIDCYARVNHAACDRTNGGLGAKVTLKGSNNDGEYR